MKYRSALLFAEPGEDAGASLATLRRVAPHLEHLSIILTHTTGADAPIQQALQALSASAAGVAHDVVIQVAPELPSEAILALCADHAIDLIVLDAGALRTSSSILLQRKRLAIAILWTRGSPGAGPIQHIGCVSLGERSLGAIAAFLRDHTDPAQSVAILSSRPVDNDEMSAGLELSGAITASAQVSSPRDAASLWQWLEHWARDRPLDLLVFAGAPGALVLGSLWTGPVLLLPPPPAAALFGRRALDIADVADDHGELRARVDQVTAFGRLEPIADQQLAIVSGGRVQNTVATLRGEAYLPADWKGVSMGIYRLSAGQILDPLLAVEHQIALIRPTASPVLLYDAELATDALRALREQRLEGPRDLLAVRMRPTRPCRAMRERLRAAGLPSLVLDARAVLDEGDAFDVSEALDAVRLARVATRLARAGFNVSGIVYRGSLAPFAPQCTVQSERDLVSSTPPEPGETAESSPSTGNLIEHELDNAKARRWLLEAIEQSAQSLHLQVYMALDDEVGRAVGAALSAAALRGVTVRVLVDSLHGLHGSFGVRNPLLERLAQSPGVELRTWRPITELPSLVDLKQRNHRKLVVADGQVALLGGRNLSHEYYSGFDEVQLTAASDWRMLPWLDAGLRIEGPAVLDLQRAFHAAWTEAGGSSFELLTPAPRGTSPARVVVHRGLRDANTLETYRELITSARDHVYVVHGFPLVLELQHALLRAIDRGVRVRALVGHVTPTHGDQLFSGPSATARTAATELVHSRMDPLVAAGAEVRLFAKREVPGWAPDLGVVHPHVHAKALSVDGARCAVGSANLDITASYWESELLVVVDDATLTRTFELEVDALMAASTLVRADDAAWRELARRRAWMRHWPGVLSV